MKDWPLVKIVEIGKDFGDAPFGTKLKTKDYVESGVPVIQGRNIKDNRFVWNKFLYVTEEKFQSLKKSHCHVGDLVFPKVGTIGITAIMPKVEGRETFLLSTNMMKMSVDSTRADIQYVFYFFCQPSIRAAIRANAGGSSQPIFNFTTLKNFNIPLPPIATQRRIATILSAYDDLIENNLRRIEILEEMARALYREWFVEFRFPGHEKVPRVSSANGAIPRGWEVKPVSDITAFLSRGISPDYDDHGDSVVLNQKCIRDQRISLEASRRQNKTIPNDKQVQFGDVLINSTGVGTLGRVAQVYVHLEKCTVDTHVTIARPKPDLDVDFFGCSLLAQQNTFERLGVGATGQTELGRAAIGGIEVAMPPAPLRDQFGMFVRPARSAVANLLNQTENLRRTRDLLLPRLLSPQGSPVQCP